MSDLSRVQQLITAAERSICDAESELADKGQHRMLGPVREALGDVLCVLSDVYNDIAEVRMDEER